MTLVQIRSAPTITLLAIIGGFIRASVSTKELARNELARRCSN